MRWFMRWLAKNKLRLSVRHLSHGIACLAQRSVCLEVGSWGEVTGLSFREEPHNNTGAIIPLLPPERVERRKPKPTHKTRSSFFLFGILRRR